MLWWCTHYEYYTIFSHRFTTRHFFCRFFFFLTFEAQYFTLVTIFSRMSSVVGQKGWFSWYKNIKRKYIKKELLHDIYLHIPCTTEVKQKGQRSFQHKSIIYTTHVIFIVRLCIPTYLDSFCKWALTKKTKQKIIIVKYIDR